jgi:hypothetical protein
MVSTYIFVQNLLDHLRKTYELKFLLMLNLWRFSLLFFLSYFTVFYSRRKKKGSTYFRSFLTFELIDQEAGIAQLVQQRGTSLNIRTLFVA